MEKKGAYTQIQLNDGYYYEVACNDLFLIGSREAWRKNEEVKVCVPLNKGELIIYNGNTNTFSFWKRAPVYINVREYEQQIKGEKDKIKRVHSGFLFCKTSDLKIITNEYLIPLYDNTMRKLTPLSTYEDFYNNLPDEFK